MIVRRMIAPGSGSTSETHPGATRTATAITGGVAGAVPTAGAAVGAKSDPVTVTESVSETGTATETATARAAARDPGALAAVEVSGLAAGGQNEPVGFQCRHHPD